VASTPSYRGFRLPDGVVNHKATEKPGLVRYDAVVLSGFRRCEGRGYFTFSGQDVLKMKVVEDDN
jgi:hypothetical protein